MSVRTRALFVAVACATLGLGTSGRAAPARDLHGVEGLVRVYDTILAANFNAVGAELRRACPPAPREACDVLAATAVWWRIQLDPNSRGHDEEFSTAVQRAITSTEAWTARAPNDAEAWFYLGGAYAARVQWRVLRDEKLAAARDGKRILQALERAIELDPSLDDAYFGMGMYKYYADVAPRAAKFLRVLLALPGGDKKTGLSQMLRARARGRLLRGEADYQLHIIYLWYERQPQRAVQILGGLRDQYPANPLFPSELARIQDEYLHDAAASLDSWQRVLTAAREHRTNEAELAEVRARLGLARVLDSLHETDQAIDHLQAIIAMRPRSPFGALSLAHLRLGEAHDRMGDREAALAAYRSAASTVPYPDVQSVRSSVNTRIGRAPDRKHAEAYRLSLMGWRLFEKNDLAAAESALSRSLALNSADPVAHYRLGRVLARAAAPGTQSRQDGAAALAEFEATIRGARACPPAILGEAYVEAARLHERAGQTEKAISLYRVASTLFGAAADTRQSATRALIRLRAATARAPRR